MKEYLLTTNNYLEPEVVSGADAYAALIMRLLYLTPGTNPLHPGMGVGLGPKYRFITDNQMPVLQSEIQRQVDTYLPDEFKSATKVYLNLKEGTKYLEIVIVADNTKYVFDTENSDTPIELSDLVS